MGSIDEALSYGAFDWTITDEDAKRALRELEAFGPRIPEAVRALGAKKITRLLDNLPDSEKKTGTYARVVIHLEAGHIYPYIRGLLSYGVFDWAITDADARAVLDVLTKVNTGTQTALLRRMGDTVLMRLLRNATKADRTAFAGVMSIIPAHQRIEVLLEYEVLLDWVVTDAETSEALAILIALPAGRLDNVLARINIDRLIDNTPQSGQHQLETLYNKSGNPEYKAKLWAAFFLRKTSADAGASGVDKAGDISSDTRREVGQEVQQLLADFRAALAGATTNADRAIVTTDHLRRLADIADRKDLELKIELANNVRITNSSASTTWSRAELEIIEATFARLPEAHVRSNPLLRKIERQGVHPDGRSVGGTHGAGVITLYDTGVSASFRATGETDLLGGDDPVTPLGETLTHELGHDVADLNPVQYAKLKALAGWEVLYHDGVVAALQAQGASEARAKAVVRGLETDRARGYTSRRPARVGGHIYMVDPYNVDGFLRRRAGHLPSDLQSPSSAKDAHGNPTDHFGYAASNPADHFAEIYTHMVHIPTQTHHDYVVGPRNRLEAAKRSRRAATATLAALAASAPAADRKNAEDDLKKAVRAVNARQRQYDALSQQWSLMREEIFGLSAPLVTAAHQELVALANAKPDAARQTAANQLAAQFRTDAEAIATPGQLTRAKLATKTLIGAL